MGAGRGRRVGLGRDEPQIPGRRRHRSEPPTTPRATPAHRRVSSADLAAGFARTLQFPLSGAGARQPRNATATSCVRGPDAGRSWQADRSPGVPMFGSALDSGPNASTSATRATQTARGPPPVVHARRIRPDTGPLDRRRLAAAGLSAVLPGLGQPFNGRRQLAALFLDPVADPPRRSGSCSSLPQSPARLLAWLAARRSSARS